MNRRWPRGVGTGPAAGTIWLAALAALATIAPAGSSVAAGPEAEGDGPAFFEKDVRPILVEHCYSCHSAQAKRLRGGLHLDSAEGWLRGGDLGPSVKPGDPDGSPLVTAVRGSDESLKMPPKGKLPDAQVAILDRWVAMGAPGPRAKEAGPVAAAQGPDRITKGREFWAFRPPADPPVPAVADGAWPSGDLDRFILAALEAKGLAPAPVADKRTLIRRATFDLTGLPPTPEEIGAFLGDGTPEAFARVVERLLASPRYGERWGRHWLDVARYADSNGLDENVAHGNAWRYRDYVVAAFNADKPYDRFVLEQLAGDLLPPADSPAEAHERLVATGFLSLGPKVLAEPDKTKLEMDLIDEQIDTTGRAFLGLTLGCARCHDHKFDPISTADYYGLAGVFKSTRTMESFKTVARWNENSIADEPDLRRKAAHDELVAARTRAIQGVVDWEDAQSFAGTPARAPSDESGFATATAATLKVLRADLASVVAAAPELPSAMGVAEGTVADVPIHVRGSHWSLGAVVPRRVPEVLSDATPPAFGPAQSGRLELARWLVDEGNPLTARVMANRVWRWHFGRGLVGTPDNFGALGDRPSNPALLDWLAHRLMAGGWSVKALHRTILLSSTYRMSSRPDPKAAAADPENRLLWRRDVRRLEAEEARDAILAVAGTLDRTVGGSLVTVKNRTFFFDHTSKDGTNYDSLRRALYLPIVRNHLYEMFQLYDFPDPSVPTGDRSTTTVAPQALFVMNSDLALKAAEDLAKSLIQRADRDDAGRVALLYERAYGRPPTPAESRRAAAYLGRFEGVPGVGGETAGPDATRRGAWQALCQAILASNEFLFLK